MRGVVVGRSPGQSPGSHTRDRRPSRQKDTARCTCFVTRLSDVRLDILQERGLLRLGEEPKRHRPSIYKPN